MASQGQAVASPSTVAGRVQAVSRQAQDASSRLATMSVPPTNSDYKMSESPKFVATHVRDQVAKIHKDTRSRLPSMSPTSKSYLSSDAPSADVATARTEVANERLAALIDESLEASFRERLRSVQVGIYCGAPSRATDCGRGSGAATELGTISVPPGPPDARATLDAKCGRAPFNGDATGAAADPRLTSAVLRPNPLERDERRRVLAASLKRRGDAEFKAGRAVEAVELYTSSLDPEHEPPLLEPRRCASQIGRTHESERDCHRVLSLCRRDGGREDTTLRVKAFFRRALRQQLDLLDDAASDPRALLLEPEISACVRCSRLCAISLRSLPRRELARSEEASRHGADSTACAGTSGEWDRRLRQQA